MRFLIVLLLSNESFGGWSFYHIGKPGEIIERLTLDDASRVIMDLPTKPIKRIENPRRKYIKITEVLEKDKNIYFEVGFLNLDLKKRSKKTPLYTLTAEKNKNKNKEKMIILESNTKIADLKIYKEYLYFSTYSEKAHEIRRICLKEIDFDSQKTNYDTELVLTSVLPIRDIIIHDEKIYLAVQNTIISFDLKHKKKKSR